MGKNIKYLLKVYRENSWRNPNFAYENISVRELKKCDA